jgi:hypothetical protein
MLLGDQIKESEMGGIFSMLVCKILVRKPEEKKKRGKPRSSREKTIKMDLK